MHSMYRSFPSGLSHDLRNPDVSAIKLTDIAHHLARIPRYNGGCTRHYSVAEHSIRVALMVYCAVDAGDRYAYAALLHDAHEAYVQDQTAPLLAAVPDLDHLCCLWGAQCDLALDVSAQERSCSAIARADRRIRDDEKTQLFGPPSVVASQWWTLCEVDLRGLGLLARPSWKFETATLDQLATLFLVCAERFRGMR